MKLKTLIILCIVLLFIVGCKQQVKSGVNSPWIGGSQGLIAVFQPISSISDVGAKAEVWETEAFPIQVLLMNKGEYKIDAHTIKLDIKGIAIGDFSGIDFQKDNTDEIEGRTEYLPDGGETTVDFGTAKYKGVVGTFYDANIFVVYGYPYKTFISVPQVCFKGDPRDTTICRIDEAKQAFASAGPIQIGTVVEKPMGKGKIALEIPVMNTGLGKVKTPDSQEFNTMYDEVQIESVPAGWECESRGTNDRARMSQKGTVLIRCMNTAPIAEKEVFTSQFDLVLSYDYQDVISQVVRIVKSPE